MCSDSPDCSSPSRLRRAFGFGLGSDMLSLDPVPSMATYIRRLVLRLRFGFWGFPPTGVCLQAQTGAKIDIDYNREPRLHDHS